ncbi:hypothetical protein D7B24_004244 [Verticillium nonalfalfae]|uniref:Uncharacterized protein n=1 Tax=Verticillium nonalfalfae TaxID=1051616 RepID=A0A3M9XWF9_9PEZI|nr:uncharacterized protein D7B24_004244 [Verticillium nonalfalfae]RNJ52152.1 hypothetical protein D7B24_004244 [Verticillium nonalfalfae]
MCGPDTSNRPRGGALAVLNPTDGLVKTEGQKMRGDLSFHTPGDPCSSTATHARWTWGEGHASSALGGLTFIIHKSGDMTRRREDCGLFHEFNFADGAVVQGGDALELVLNQPISLQVGDDGIIGRRISVMSGADNAWQNAVAEGIVGFNFAQPLSASL